MNLLEESEEITSIRNTVRRFVIKEFPPAILAQWERDDHMPREVSTHLGQLGLSGLCVPEEYGGLGRHVVAMTVVIEELTRWHQALSALFNMSANYGAMNIAESGSAEQKEKLLPGLMSGELMFAYGLSEPDIGADLADVKTTAEMRGDCVVVNGSKRWCTGAGMADYVYALVRSGPVTERRKNLTFLLIPTDAPGITLSQMPIMGARGIPTNDVVFDNVEVPVENIVGGPERWNDAWSILAGPSLEVEKLAPTAIALGMAYAAVEDAWEYSQQRVQGGKHICGHQSVRHTLSDAQTKLLSCRLLLRYAATLVEQRKPSAVVTSMAKLHVCEMAKEIVLDCQQSVLGAYGYSEEFRMSRLARDVLSCPIVGGSSAIQRNNIANLLKLPRE